MIIEKRTKQRVSKWRVSSCLIEIINSLLPGVVVITVDGRATVILQTPKPQTQRARLAQSVEHETLNLRVVGSSPTLGAIIFYFD